MTGEAAVGVKCNNVLNIGLGYVPSQASPSSGYNVLCSQCKTDSPVTNYEHYNTLDCTRIKQFLSAEAIMN